MFSVGARLRHQGDPVKGSRFIASVAPVPSEAEARLFLGEVSAEFGDASHHCSAWRIARPAIDRCNDDGEPGGSAGRPILAQLVGRDLINVAVVVTRYFGGTKLGVGGLIRAYGACAAAALDLADLVDYQPLTTLTATVGHDDAERCERAIKVAGAAIDATDYGAQVTYRFSVAEALVAATIEAVAEATAGRATIDPDPPATSLP